MGISILASSLLSAFVCIKNHRGLLTGKDSFAVESAWKGQGIIIPSAEQESDDTSDDVDERA